MARLAAFAKASASLEIVATPKPWRPGHPVRRGFPAQAEAPLEYWIAR